MFVYGSAGISIEKSKYYIIRFYDVIPADYKRGVLLADKPIEIRGIKDEITL